MEYQPAAEINYLHKLFSQPPEIVAACNRVNLRIEARIRMAAGNARMTQERLTGHEWRNGVFTAVSAALVGIGIVWCLL
jgi:hypothetical protein